MEKTLSIIIPAYNMELFLKQTLDSMVVNEVLDDLDVCIINDGSTDRTAEIAQEYVDKYPDTFRLFNKENGGHGSALNMGIDVARGKYYRPIDGDDWVDRDALIAVIADLKKLNCDVDMVLTNFRKVLIKSNRTINVRCNNIYNMAQINRGEVKTREGRTLCIYGRVYDFNKDLFDYAPQYLFHFVSYRTSLLRDNNVRFDEHCFYDDMEYDIFPLPYVKTVLPLDRYLYQYRLEREGQSVDESSFIKHREQRKQIVYHLTKYFVENKKKFGANVYKHLYSDIIWKIVRQYEIYFSMPKSKQTLEEIQEFDRLIKSVDENIYSEASTREIKLFRISPKILYGMVLKRMEAKKEQAEKEARKHKSWTIESDLPMHKEIWKRYILKYLHLAWLDKKMRDLRRFKNIHKGERCFITCTGPSLRIEDLEKLDNEYTIGMNSIIKAYSLTDWRCSYYVLVDLFAFGKYLRENEIEGGRFCNVNAFLHCRVNPKTKYGNEKYCLIDYANHKPEWIKKGKIKISSDISVCFYDCFTATNMAIQLAMYMGFKKIYIIGADCDYSSSKQIHFVEMPDDKQKIAGGWLPDAVKLSIDGYKAIKKYAEKHNVEIINATRGGKLEVFKRENLDDILAGLEKK